MLGFRSRPVRCPLSSDAPVWILHLEETRVAEVQAEGNRGVRPAVLQPPPPASSERAAATTTARTAPGAEPHTTDLRHDEILDGLKEVRRRPSGCFGPPGGPRPRAARTICAGSILGFHTSAWSRLALRRAGSLHLPGCRAGCRRFNRVSGLFLSSGDGRLGIRCPEASQRAGVSFAQQKRCPRCGGIPVEDAETVCGTSVTRLRSAYPSPTRWGDRRTGRFRGLAVAATAG